MAALNDITGDAIQTKVVSDLYRDNWDRIFNKSGPHDGGVAWIGKALPVTTPSGDHIFGKNKKNTTTNKETESTCSGVQERHRAGDAGTSGESGCPISVREDKDCVHCSCQST